jgi:hypothetical protein
MFEIARQLEQTAIRFEPAVLILPGLAAVLLGLFVWLGGLGFRRTLVAAIGGVTGGACGFFISGQNMVPAVIAAGVTAAAAMMLEKIFIAILAGVLVTILAFAVFARPDTENTTEAVTAKIQKSKETFDTRQSVEIAKEYIADFAARIKRILSQMPVYNYVIIAVIAIVFMAAGFFRQRLISAFCCAALGTMLIFAGMILLLLYKGAAPVSKICQNQLFYQGVLGVMTALGVAEQLLLCPQIKEKLTGKKGKSKNR